MQSPSNMNVNFMYFVTWVCKILDLIISKILLQGKVPRFYTLVRVEEVPPKMYCISSATKNAIMEVSPKIPIYTFLATLAYNGISIIAFLKAPALECIFGDTWLTGIFGGTSSTRASICK